MIVADGAPAAGRDRALDIAAFQADVRRMLPLWDHIGLRIERADDVIICSVPLNDANANHFGGVHAAVQWAAAEAVGGIGSLAHSELAACWIAVRDVTIRFHRVARTTLRAEAAFDATLVTDIFTQLAATGRADYEIAVTLYNTEGDAVTTAIGHYHVRKEAP